MLRAHGKRIGNYNASIMRRDKVPSRTRARSRLLGRGLLADVAREKKREREREFAVPALQKNEEKKKKKKRKEKKREESSNRAVLIEIHLRPPFVFSLPLYLRLYSRHDAPRTARERTRTAGLLRPKTMIVTISLDAAAEKDYASADRHVRTARYIIDFQT
ncbi:hypothetical protein PUN28_016833 [Cardiocondyla obscurior]|uniref:Uncharacterized protein n=1 Tax=Cardiocondyla obscurior TaxID=286306 RepID=A0AAW2ERB7_9HYME